MTAEFLPYDQAAMQKWLDSMPAPEPEPPDPRRHFIVSITSNPPPKIVMEEKYGEDGSLALIPKDDEAMRKILATWDAKPVWHRVAAVDDRGLTHSEGLGGGGEVSGTRRMATGCGLMVEDEAGDSNSSTRLTETVADPWVWESRCHEQGCWAVPRKE